MNAPPIGRAGITNGVLFRVPDALRNIRYNWEVTKKSFEQIIQTMQSIVGSIKQTMSSKEDW